MRHDVDLAEQNPLYKVIVENVVLNQVAADVQFVKVMDEFFVKVKNARRSKSRTLADRLIPQDKLIVSWLEGSPEKKAQIEKEMTPEELDLAAFMRTEYAKIRDYLVKQQVIEQGIENYYTHIRRGFLETVKDDGLIKAFKEVFRQNELDEITFKIIDDDTGSILPLEKFFSFSLKRKGGLVPTQNVSRSFEQYLRTFYRKVALDSLVPLVDIYVYSVEPKQTTETGLQMDRSLRKFVNEWLNNKRGRTFSFGGFLKQGGKLDSTLRFSKSLVTFLDLGFNVATGVASAVGEQTMVFKSVGVKQALGAARLATPKGRALVEKYKTLTGRGVFEELFSPSKNIGDKLLDGAMVLFSASSKFANDVYFLASLTKEEYESGNVSNKRIADMRLDIGRWRPVSEFKSIVGSTSVGQVGTQYKTWAIPIITTTIKNWSKILKTLKSGKSPIGTRELQEELRGIILIAMVTALFAGDDDEEDGSFVGTLRQKVVRELFTSVGALSPATFASTPRLISFGEDVRDALMSLLTLERYKTKEGYKGIEDLKRIFTPRLIKQFLPEKKETTQKNPFLRSSQQKDNPFIRK